MLLPRASQHELELTRDPAHIIASLEPPYDHFRKSHYRDLSGSTLVEAIEDEDENESNMLIPDLGQIKLGRCHLYQSLVPDRKQKRSGRHQHQHPVTPIVQSSPRTNIARHELKSRRKRRGIVDPLGVRTSLHNHHRRSKGQSITSQHYEQWINALLSCSVRNKSRQSASHTTQSAVKRERDLLALHCELSFDNPDFEQKVLAFSSNSSLSTMSCESQATTVAEKEHIIRTAPRIHRPSRSFGWLNTLRTVKSAPHVRSKSSVASDLNKPLPAPPEMQMNGGPTTPHSNAPQKSGKRSYSPRKKIKDAAGFDVGSLLPKRQMLDLRYHSRILHKPSRSLVVKSSEPHCALRRSRKLSKSVDIPSIHTIDVENDVSSHLASEELGQYGVMQYKNSDCHLSTLQSASPIRPASNVGSTRNYSRLFRQSEVLSSHLISEHNPVSEDGQESSTESTRSSSYVPSFPMIPPRISSRSAVKRTSRSYRVADVKKRHLAIEKDRKGKAGRRDKGSRSSIQSFIPDQVSDDVNVAKELARSQSPNKTETATIKSLELTTDGCQRTCDNEEQVTRGSTVVDLDDVSSMSRDTGMWTGQRRQHSEDFSSSTTNDTIGTIILCLSSPNEYQAQLHRRSGSISTQETTSINGESELYDTESQALLQPSLPTTRSNSLKRLSNSSHPVVSGHVRSSRSMPSMKDITDSGKPLPELPLHLSRKLELEVPSQQQDRKDSADSTSTLSDFPAPPPLKFSKLSIHKAVTKQATTSEAKPDMKCDSGVTADEKVISDDSQPDAQIAATPLMQVAHTEATRVGGIEDPSRTDKEFTNTIFKRKPLNRDSSSSGSRTLTPSSLRNTSSTPVFPLRRPNIPRRRSSKAFVSDSDLYGNMRLSHYLGYIYGNGNVNGSRTLSADLLEEFGGLTGSAGNNGMGLRCDPMYRHSNASLATLVRVDSPTLPPW